MKHLLRIVFFTLLSFICVHSIVNAQTIVQRPAIAFETADRSVLYIKQLNPDSAVQAFDFHAIDPTDIDSVRHLAILGMTQDGKRIIYAAELGYLERSNSQHLVYYGLFSSVLHPRPNAFNPFVGDIKILKLAPFGSLSFRPVGVLSKYGTQWWVTFTSGSSGNRPQLAFYHGNVDGTGNIDSAIVTADITGNYELQSYHTSNISIDPSNNNMVAASVDLLGNQSIDNRFMLYHWSLGSPIRVVDFTGSIKGLKQDVVQLDSLFGLTVQTVGDGSNVDIAFTNLGTVPNNTLKFYRTKYNATPIDLTSPIRSSIQRSSIPDTMDFFAGSNIGPYRENLSNDAQRGMGGDFSFSTPNTGNDTAIFITHDSPETGTVDGRNQRSAIFMQDFTNNGTATMVYNNPAAQELQPVFVTMPYLVPPIIHYAGIRVVPSSYDFGSNDTATTVHSTITITDTSAFVPVIIDSVKITGPNASQFSVSDTFPQTLAVSSHITADVTFAPVGAAGSRNAMLTVYFAGSHDSTRQIRLTGTAKVKPAGGVNEDPALSIDVSIMPNPFTSSTAISLTSPEAGALGIVVHDALGREVYVSDVRRVGQGTTENFTFDAKSLGLPNGVYYVTAFLGDRQFSRQVVFIR
jgi:hypothetical protein